MSDDYPRRYITSPPHNVQVAESNVVDVTPFRRMGHNLSVGANFETVWRDSSLYIYLTAAEKVDIYSGNIQDAQNGTGAKTIFIKGLDADYNIISETISTHATDGRISVSSVNSYLRLFTVRVETSGSYGTNVGAISIDNAAGTVIMAYIEAAEGKALQCVWTVPLGKTATVLRWAYSEVKAKVSAVALFVRPFGKSWYIGKYKLLNNMLGDSDLKMPIICAAKTDIEIRAWATGGSGQVSATFEGYYQ